MYGYLVIWLFVDMRVPTFVGGYLMTGASVHSKLRLEHSATFDSAM